MKSRITKDYLAYLWLSFFHCSCDDYSGDSELKQWGDLAMMLRIVGVKHTHPMRKKLDKFLATGH